MSRQKEILEELQTVITGKTLDALLPPLVFVLANGWLGLTGAIMGALGLSVVMMARRLIKKESLKYSLGGFLGVAIASGLAYWTQNAANYFISSAVTTGVLVLVAIITIVIDRPLALWASHLTRGWPMDWFMRADVKPAYRQVTWMWLLFFILRLMAQVGGLIQGDATQLFWVNTILGWPVTVVVLIASYVYGIWKLNQLGGPGVEEFMQNKPQPWKGQTRGF